MSGLLEVGHLTVEFAAQQGGVIAVRDVSFQIAPGEVLGLVGESGSGKSVTALAILRLLPPQARIHGSIRFRGEELLAVPEPEMRRIRGAGNQHDFPGADDGTESGDARRRPDCRGRAGARATTAVRKCTGSKGTGMEAARSRLCARSPSPTPNGAPATIRTSFPAASASG